MPASSRPIISMTGITKVYNVGGEEVRALDGANLTIHEGEYVSIIGPSGSGKSTLMNIIGCLDVADSGEYILDGQSIEQYSEEELARIRNRKIGFIFQNFNLLSRMTAQGNVELPLIYQRVHYSERKERAAKALERVGLASRSAHKPTELSGGQQQRVAVARALATNPAILLADEPTGNLDSKTGEDIMALFHELHDAGDTIVVITHNEEIARQTQRRIRIMDGRVSEVTA
ncbi:putative ABC transporter ATP-binding protein YknY [bioreactor metagenome]|uniref:Putative ABC transporter ATP-binding protein YknY n=1 Tax=bioreactor metagenome TaxID=1076179 RepID=A0A645BBN9_9ZZZZ